MNKLKCLALTGLIASAIQVNAQSGEEFKDWHLQDYGKEVRGINVEKAYNELLVNKTPQAEIIVAVIDSGIDIEHEDLAPVIWTNEDEIPGNGIDDDKNGYIDDVHGWNFLGNPNGDMVGKDNLEVTRTYKQLSKKWEGKKPLNLSKKELADWKYYQKVKNEFEEGRNKAVEMKKRFDGFNTMWTGANDLLTKEIKEGFTLEDLKAYEPETPKGTKAKEFMLGMFKNQVTPDYVKNWGDYVDGQYNWYYNTDVDVRASIIKDDPNNLRETGYGNNNVYGPDASHGTHVAGIIGAVRNNGIGMNGIANNIKIMPVRTVPGGDEHDKDVANAIRYAVDNGARVVNMSFGKSFSPNEKLVAGAIQYAEDNGVLLIHAAGNDNKNLDVEDNFPTNYSKYIRGKVKTFMTIGASSKSLDKDFPADFSNYGDKKVDIFAPGVKIYSTFPENEYNAISGTSMAAPVVSGVAALILSYYPDLSGKQVKRILEKSGRDMKNTQVYLPGSGGTDDDGKEISKKVVDFGDLSRSNRLIDAYKALQLADRKSKY